MKLKRFFLSFYILLFYYKGGNTGLVGGSVPVFDEVVVSTELMTNIEMIDPGSGVAVCQAGVVLDSLDNALAEQGLMVPLDLGAKVMITLNLNYNFHQFFVAKVFLIPIKKMYVIFILHPTKKVNNNFN